MQLPRGSVSEIVVAGVSAMANTMGSRICLLRPRGALRRGLQLRRPTCAPGYVIAASRVTATLLPPRRAVRSSRRALAPATRSGTAWQPQRRRASPQHGPGPTL